MSNSTVDRLAEKLSLVKVEPQPSYIESSGRWRWPLPKQAHFPGCCIEVVTASREWWEYAPSEAKPHPHAEGVRLRDDVWYWTVPDLLRDAAPDLKVAVGEATQAVQAFLDMVNVIQKWQTLPIPSILETAQHNCPIILEHLRAAIAKAEGRS